MKETSEYSLEEAQEGKKTQKRRFQEWLAKIFLNYYWKIGELSPQAQGYFFNDFAQAISSGKKLSLAEAAKNLLSGFEQEIIGQENIPKTGPVVVAGNHWKGGPMQGMWSHFLASEKVKEIRDVDVRWMIQDSIEVPRLGKIRTMKEMPASAYFIEKIAKAFDPDLTVVTAPFKIDRAEAKQKIRDGFKLPISTFRTLKSGGVVGFYPEAAASHQLVPAWPGSKVLLEKIAKISPSAQIQPVGILSQERKLILNFGQPFPIGEVFQAEVEPGDYLMYKIALLLPQSLGGYYSRPYIH